MSIRLKLSWHASLREARGCHEEVLDTEYRTAAELFDSLDLPLGREHVKVAINHEMSAWDQALAEGDAVSFIPPVAGG